MPNEKLNEYMIAVANLASFGKADLETMLAQQLPPIHVCFADLRSSFTMMEYVAAIGDELLSLHSKPVGGRELTALKVKWCNVLDPEENPSGDTGFFLIQAYANRFVSGDQP